MISMRGRLMVSVRRKPEARHRFLNGLLQLLLERDAMGQDEYHPLSKKGTNLVDDGGIGYMIIDAIDTMQIMGLQDEYQRARDWVANNLTFDRDGNFNTFEVGLTSPHRLAVASSSSWLFIDYNPCFRRSPYGIPPLGRGSHIFGES